MEEVDARMKPASNATFMYFSIAWVSGMESGKILPLGGKCLAADLLHPVWK